jgi:hypothetical protein
LRFLDIGSPLFKPAEFTIIRIHEEAGQPPS